MLDQAATTTGGVAAAGGGAALLDDGAPGQAASIARTKAALLAAPKSLSGEQRLAALPAGRGVVQSRRDLVRRWQLSQPRHPAARRS
jgi:hypothetical protein